MVMAMDVAGEIVVDRQPVRKWSSLGIPSGLAVFYCANVLLIRSVLFRE